MTQGDLRVAFFIGLEIDRSHARGNASRDTPQVMSNLWGSVQSVGTILLSSYRTLPGQRLIHQQLCNFHHLHDRQHLLAA
ncbi:MAG: hypothetical protein K0S85_4185 [Pseudomonas orientalis]|nr:hypothetical protein [Pseudomonas orientalis]